MATSIKRYKYYEQVRDNNLDRLAKSRNEYLALKGVGKSVIDSLKGKLKWSEESHSSLTKKAAEQEVRIENLSLRLRDSEEEINQTRNEVGVERSQRIKVENDLKTAVKNTRKTIVEETLELV